MTPELSIRPMAAADLPAVMAIENQAFGNPWSEAMVLQELSQEWSTVLVAEMETPEGWVVSGFAIFWIIHDEVQVLNVATDARFRRRGIGRAMLEAVIAAGRARNCRMAHLEVRRSNSAAIGLYESMGFRSVGLRANYYGDNLEDAVVMLKDL